MDPAKDTTTNTPATRQEKERLAALHLEKWRSEFSNRLKANAQWVRQFLHGRK